MFKNISKIFNSYLVNFKNDFVNSVKDKKRLLIILFVVALFMIVALYVYKYFIKNLINKNHKVNKEYVNKNNNNSDDVLVLYFYTQWCPYCKQSMPEIKKFEDYVNGLNAENSYKITVTKIDCDENSAMATKYKIQGYPTIKLIYKGKVYDYDAKPTKENLIQFLESTVKK
jgi:thiol-disulfide isomerase/thioredoxin